MAPISDVEDLPLPPMMLDLPGRIALATRCRDCDAVPKVVDAGAVVEQPDGTRVQIMHNGLKVIEDGYCGAWMTELIARCRGHHEPQEECLFDALTSVLPPDATMIELGSNWAYYACWFLNGWPNRRAVLLEPDPANRQVGDRNLALNGIAATVLDGFVGAEPGPPQPFQTERSGTLDLRRYSVPELADSYGLATVDLLHCDVQGAETDALTGCLPLFRAGRIRWVVVSTHVHQISGDCLTHPKCLNILRRAGAIIEAEHSPAESFSGDGLIVARFGAAPPGWRCPAISVARTDESLFRNPLYDLADAMPAAERALDPERIVRDVFRALLLRDPEPATLDGFSKTLQATGDVHRFLADVLTSPEFAARHEAVLATYMSRPGPDPERGALPGLTPASSDGKHASQL